MSPEHPDLRLWHRNVGPPVALDLARAAVEPTGVDVLSWNLAIGAARLEVLLERLRRDDGVGTDPARPLVVLAQEAFRAGPEVPGHAPGRHHGGKARGAGRADIVQVARSLGMSLRYAPSMRNGHSRTDRGNAILATAPLGPATHLELPYVRQRRVAMAARLLSLPGLLMASAHLDTHGQPGGRTVGRFGAGRTLQARELGRLLTEVAEEDAIVLGADLNTPLGGRDPAVAALQDCGFISQGAEGPGWHTHHGAVRLRLDHVLLRGGARMPIGARLRRVDETRHDRGRHIFGSDHHPLLLRLDPGGGVQGKE